VRGAQALEAALASVVHGSLCRLVMGRRVA
jgi:hypothetical protein